MVIKLNVVFKFVLLIVNQFFCCQSIFVLDK